MILNKINTYILGLCIIFTGLALSHQEASAQQADSLSVIEGTVADASNGELLANVTVKLKELNKETQTNQEGKFSFSDINLMNKNPQEITLVIDHNGYEKLSKTIQANEASDIKLQLEPKPQIN